MPLVPSARLVGLASLSLLTACMGRDGKYGADTAPSGGDGGVVTECGDESQYDDGWRIEGNATFQDPDAVALDSGGANVLANKCITAIDPTPALAGSPPEILASSAICEDGSFVIAGIQENPAIGTFVVVDDCDGEPDDLMTSATGISGAFVEGLGPGDALTDIVARVVTNTYRTTILDELKGAGYDGVEDETFQFLGGRLISDAGAPLDDHTINCGACSYPPAYADTDPSDGLYTTGGAANTSTDADADGFFMVPMAAIGTYTCTDGSGTDLTTSTYGSLPGYGVFIEVRCVAN